jgi:hypothetical protein
MTSSESAGVSRSGREGMSTRSVQFLPIAGAAEELRLEGQFGPGNAPGDTIRLNVLSAYRALERAAMER